MKEIVLYNTDEEAVLRLLQAVLTKLGYGVLAVRNGHEALNLALARSVNAVILDQHMPDTTGEELAAKLKGFRPEVPVVIFSGQPGTSPKPSCVDAFIAKSAGLDAVLAVVHRLMQAPRRENPPVRRFPRYRAQLALGVVVGHAGELEMLHGTTITVGEGGVGGKIEGKLQVGELVLLQIHDAQRNLSLEPRAQVRYRNPDSYGFEFLDITSYQKAAIRQFCQEVASA
jgi:CheY-like chemotaxis protein